MNWLTVAAGMAAGTGLAMRTRPGTIDGDEVISAHGILGGVVLALLVYTLNTFYFHNDALKQLATGVLTFALGTSFFAVVNSRRKPSSPNPRLEC